MEYSYEGGEAHLKVLSVLRLISVKCHLPKSVIVNLIVNIWVLFAPNNKC